MREWIDQEGAEDLRFHCRVLSRRDLASFPRRPTTLSIEEVSQIMFRACGMYDGPIDGRNFYVLHTIETALESLSEYRREPLDEIVSGFEESRRLRRLGLLPEAVVSDFHVVVGRAPLRFVDVTEGRVV